ncbi:MAG: hypothetical protein K2W99_04990 [Chthoniobacterales bacterium]|nr:hypothetical protein [Chthoniobacterales bacterium]
MNQIDGFLTDLDIKDLKIASSLPLDKPTMLLVLGPDRSGTSLTARLLECLGGKNSKHLMLPNEGNPTGYFEDMDVYSFNDNVLLPRLGLYWHSISCVDWNCLTSSVRSQLEQEALDIICKNYSPISSHSLFILKEPRIGMLLPFWLPVLHRAGFDVKIISILRDPMSVAQSLKRCHGFSITHGGVWYVARWLAILVSIQKLPIVFIYFNDIFINPLKIINLIANQLQLALSNDIEEQICTFTTTYLDRRLRHFKTNKKDLLLDSNLPVVAVKIYNALLNVCRDQHIEKAIKIISSMKQIFLEAQPLFKKFDEVFNSYYYSETHIIG